MTPASARRVSGPSGGIAAASASGGVIAVPAPSRPRPSRPATARPARSTRSRRTRAAAARAPLGLRASAYFRALPDHALLDRIVRGRVWIPLLGVLLAGIVFMQVEVLKLNAGIGRSLERSSSLQGQNELLRANVAQLSDEQRIERLAAQMGMVMPAPTQLRFVRSGASSVERALGSIHAPDATGFIAQLPTPGAPAAQQGTSVNTSPGLTPTGASPSTSTSTGAPATTATSSASSGTTGSATAAASTPTSTGAATAGSTSAGTTSAGTSGSGSSGSGSSGSGTATVTPTAPTTSAGATSQSNSSSSGGVGVTPVGG